MARRLEIELTSARSDGTWTWRAAGALEPRGSLDASLLYHGAKTGDVVRAETEFGIDGITVVAVEAPRAPTPEDKDRIELLERPIAASVTTQLVGRARPGRGEERRRDDRPGRDRAPRTRPAGKPAAPLPPMQGTAGEGTADATTAGRRDERARRDGDGPRTSSRTGEERRARARSQDHRSQDQGAAPESHPRGAGKDGTSAGGRGAARANGKPQSGEARAHGGQRHDESASRQHRLSPGNKHRNAMLDSLPPEQRPVAQQLLRGGIPAVRTALFFERERAREEGRPEPSAEGVIGIAESLVTKVKAAEWRDRAEAAVAAGTALATRDLRALVNGSEVARDEASRDLVVALREMLEQRVEANHRAWSDEVARYLDEGQVTRALRLSARPPDPAARFSAELAVRLRDAAGAALSPELSPERWLALLVAVSESPVRRTVKPQGIPANPPAELLEAARQQCGRVPALAPLLGISVPPPPGPARPNVPVRSHGRRPTRASRPGRAAPPAQSAPPAPSAHSRKTEVAAADAVEVKEEPATSTAEDQPATIEPPTAAGEQATAEDQPATIEPPTAEVASTAEAGPTDATAEIVAQAADSSTSAEDDDGASLDDARVTQPS